MLKKFKEWFEHSMNHMLEKSIFTEKIIESQSEPNKSLTIHQLTSQCLGQITVWDAGFLDLEIVGISSGEKILYEHYEVEEVSNFDMIFSRYIELMQLEN